MYEDREPHGKTVEPMKFARGREKVARRAIRREMAGARALSCASGSAVASPQSRVDARASERTGDADGFGRRFDVDEASRERPRSRCGQLLRRVSPPKSFSQSRADVRGSSPRPHVKKRLVPGRLAGRDPKNERLVPKRGSACAKRGRRFLEEGESFQRGGAAPSSRSNWALRDYEKSAGDAHRTDVADGSDGTELLRGGALVIAVKLFATTRIIEKCNCTHSPGRREVIP